MMAYESEYGTFARTRDLMDLPLDDLIDWATTCSDEGMRLHAKFLLDKKAARDGARLA